MGLAEERRSLGAKLGTEALYLERCNQLSSLHGRKLRWRAAFPKSLWNWVQVGLGIIRNGTKRWERVISRSSAKAPEGEVQGSSDGAEEGMGRTLLRRGGFAELGSALCFGALW